MIVIFEVQGHDFNVLIKQIIKNIVKRDSDKYGVLALQLLELHVFDGVDDLIIECLIHCPCILIYSTSFIILKLELVS